MSLSLIPPHLIAVFDAVLDAPYLIATVFDVVYSRPQNSGGGGFRLTREVLDPLPPGQPPPPTILKPRINGLMD